MKLKICGMKYRENIEAAAQLLPDFIGFIFWKPSKRFFDGELPEISDSIKKVGVFVNADLEEILSKVKQCRLDVVQLHGDENTVFCQSLTDKNIPVIKAFYVGNDFDFEILKRFEPVSDYFLFDTKGKLPGGNGVPFNWEILKQYESEKPFFLSGGIGPDDLETIKKLKLKIFAIDVNSGFESQPGLKNIPLLKQFKSQLP